jgi:hypothetical protein
MLELGWDLQMYLFREGAAGVLELNDNLSRWWVRLLCTPEEIRDSCYVSFLVWLKENPEQQWNAAGYDGEVYPDPDMPELDTQEELDWMHQVIEAEAYDAHLANEQIEALEDLLDAEPERFEEMVAEGTLVRFQEFATGGDIDGDQPAKRSRKRGKRAHPQGF